MIYAGQNIYQVKTESGEPAYAIIHPMVLFNFFSLIFSRVRFTKHITVMRFIDICRELISTQKKTKTI